MIPHRVNVKYFVTDPAAVELDSFIPVFHRWIQQQVVDELLIDVADYKHVDNGPGIMLIGHEADYSLDVGEGRPGLLYSRKRDQPATFAEAVRLAWKQALVGAQLVEADGSLATKLHFDTAEVEIAFPDVLVAPNNEETFAAIKADLEALAADLYGASGVTVERVANDAREPLTVRVRAEAKAELGDLLSRLN